MDLVGRIGDIIVHTVLDLYFTVKSSLEDRFSRENWWYYDTYSIWFILYRAHGALLFLCISSYLQCFITYLAVVAASWGTWVDQGGGAGGRSMK